MNYPDPRTAAPEDPTPTPDSYQQGFDAFFESKPTVDNYLDIDNPNPIEGDSPFADAYNAGFDHARDFFLRQNQN